MPFPRGEGRWQVSVNGGQQPKWNPRGGELFFVSGNDLMAADVSLEPSVRVGAPYRLFGGDTVDTTLTDPGDYANYYDVAPDGQRFAVVKGLRKGSSDIVLAENAINPPTRPGADR